MWGAGDPSVRGPIVASRHPNSIKLRNAIGAHGGSYSVYRALAIAMRELEPSHRPDLHNTYPGISKQDEQTVFLTSFLLSSMN